METMSVLWNCRRPDQTEKLASAAFFGTRTNIPLATVETQQWSQPSNNSKRNATIDGNLSNNQQQEQIENHAGISTNNPQTPRPITIKKQHQPSHAPPTPAKLPAPTLLQPPPHNLRTSRERVSIRCLHARKPQQLVVEQFVRVCGGLAAASRLAS